MKNEIYKILKEEHFTDWLNKKNLSFLTNGLKRLFYSKNKTKIKEFAKNIFEKNIPFNEISILIDYLNRKKLSKYLCKNKNLFAKEYLKYYINNKIKEIEEEKTNISKIFSLKEIEIINLHLEWLLNLSKYIIDNNYKFQYQDYKNCPLNNRLQYFLKIPTFKINQFKLKHKKLHTLTEEIIKIKEKEEYFYLVLLYEELLLNSIYFREAINSMFLYQQSISIYIDKTTNLFNRIKFLQDINSYKNKYLLIINIKEFSKINLTYGAKFGDKTLKIVADYIQNLDIVKIYRIYADEFAIILRNKQDTINLIEQIDEKIVIKEIDYIISLYGSYRKIDSHSFEICEYAILKSKKNSFINADNLKYEDIISFKQNLSTTQIIKLAFLNNKIHVFTQPILDIKQNKITKQECLMRIEDKKGNILTPFQFLNILENMSIYHEYTKNIIYNAFECNKNNNLEFSINLSLSDLENKETVDFLIDTLKAYPKTAKRCVIEILENEAIKNYTLANRFFNEVKQYGVKIAIDDFGSGYSNFAYIFSLNIDYIKIDGSIIKKIEDNKMQELIKTLVKMSHALNIKVIAEFVENEHILNILKELNIDFAQGYFIGKPSICKK